MATPTIIHARTITIMDPPMIVERCKRLESILSPYTHATALLQPYKP